MFACFRRKSATVSMGSVRTTGSAGTTTPSGRLVLRSCTAAARPVPTGTTLSRTTSVVNSVKTSSVSRFVGCLEKDAGFSVSPSSFRSTFRHRHSLSLSHS
uniref:(northern house mosquito) hypothetical protein n=1 Tax=Culex pipiens TaxID=7175 RepID=A0A8D8CPS4_CULPI